MMSLFQLLRARIRGLVDAPVQKARVEIFGEMARDEAERFQDYGLAGHPGAGEGLVLEMGGHTVIIRMDRIKDRPALAEFDVAVWHKEGHKVHLKAGGLIEATCRRWVVNASEGYEVNSPTVVINASGGVTVQAPTLVASGEVQAPTVTAASSLSVAGEEMADHRHGQVVAGTDVSGGPV
jgi:phage baseplate assembly protein V